MLVAVWLYFSLLKCCVLCLLLLFSLVLVCVSWCCWFNWWIGLSVCVVLVCRDFALFCYMWASFGFIVIFSVWRLHLWGTCVICVWELVCWFWLRVCNNVVIGLFVYLVVIDDLVIAVIWLVCLACGIMLVTDVFFVTGFGVDFIVFVAYA